MKILVTGAAGQIGSELVPALAKRYGAECVVASDVRMYHTTDQPHSVKQEHLDCNDIGELQEVVRRHRIDTIYHLGALLSAVAEGKPQAAWKVNMGGLYNVLEVARQYGCSMFFPSSIGAFGATTPEMNTPQVTIQRPTTMYGVTKVAGELLCDYYAQRFGVDTRGLRLPGLISYTAMPGGGTTDYAVEIFHQAVRYQHYSCFLKEDTNLDMMYMPDAIRAMIELMEADPTMLKHRNAYNISAMSISPAMLAKAIKKHIPAFEIDYEVDPIRQAIAESWPRAVEDGCAREDWGWQEQYDLATMTEDMLKNLRPLRRASKSKEYINAN